MRFKRNEQDERCSPFCFLGMGKQNPLQSPCTPSTFLVSLTSSFSSLLSVSTFSLVTFWSSLFSSFLPKWPREFRVSDRLSSSPFQLSSSRFPFSLGTQPAPSAPSSCFYPQPILTDTSSSTGLTTPRALKDWPSRSPTQISLQTMSLVPPLFALFDFLALLFFFF